MTSGAAPGSESWMVTMGRSMSGYWLTPRRVKAMPPKTISAIISIHAKTGRLIEIEARLMLLLHRLHGSLGWRRFLHAHVHAVGERRGPRHHEGVARHQPLQDLHHAFADKKAGTDPAQNRLGVFHQERDEAALRRQDRR